VKEMGKQWRVILKRRRRKAREKRRKERLKLLLKELKKA
jgi:hypothetical protein